MLEADQLKDPAFYPEASDYLEGFLRESPAKVVFKSVIIISF